MGLIQDIDFWMEALGPFEPEPIIAVAVSGGGDSMALAWLLTEWIHRRNGQLHILCVDHGLRPESASDCEFVQRSFAGVPAMRHRTLTWLGDKPQTGIQEAAREARYRLLTEHCLAHGILHLCVAHTLDDQAETYAIRESHGSGERGLAAMPALRQLHGVRLLRPLLEAPRRALREFLTQKGKSWLEDPSNTLGKFERSRHRATIQAANSAEQLAEKAIRFGLARDGIERKAARLLAATAMIHPAGYIEIDPKPWAKEKAEVQELAVCDLLRLVGGRAYAPDLSARRRLLRWLSAPSGGFTLAGCELGVRRGRCIISREAAGISDQRTGNGDARFAWDRRFRISVGGAADSWSVSAFNDDNLSELSRSGGIQLKMQNIPPPARRSLPAFRQQNRVVAVPHLGLGLGLGKNIRVSLSPEFSATSCGFTVAPAGSKTI